MNDFLNLNDEVTTLLCSLTDKQAVFFYHVVSHINLHIGSEL